MTVRERMGLLTATRVSVIIPGRGRTVQSRNFLDRFRFGVRQHGWARAPGVFAFLTRPVSFNEERSFRGPVVASETARNRCKSIVPIAAKHIIAEA